MPRAELSLEIPDGLWIREVSRAHPTAQFRVLAIINNGSKGIALVEIRSDEQESIITDIDAAEAVTTIEVLQQDEHRHLVEIAIEKPFFLDIAERSGVPLETPFSFEDGTIEWVLTISNDRLQSLGSELQESQVEFTIKSITPEVTSESFLTDRQWSVIHAALECGYYDTPRECTQAEVASRVGLAKSTCSQVLHRAEERIIKRWVHEQSRPDVPNSIQSLGDA